MPKRKVLTDYPEAMQRQIVAQPARKPIAELISKPMCGKSAAAGQVFQAIQSALKQTTFIVPE